jgi:hypothetical protein
MKARNERTINVKEDALPLPELSGYDGDDGAVVHALGFHGFQRTAFPSPFISPCDFESYSTVLSASLFRFRRSGRIKNLKVGFR